MAAKKKSKLKPKSKPKSKAIAVRRDTIKRAPAEPKLDPVQRAADVLSQENPPTSELADAFADLKRYEANIESVVKMARDRVEQVLRSQGTQDAETGTLHLDAGGWKLEARPRSVKHSAKTVEALLRAKGLSPEKYMQRKVVYEVDESMLSSLVDIGNITQDELEACRPPLAYNIMSPRSLKELPENV